MGSRWRRVGMAVCAVVVATTGAVLVAEPALAIPGRVVVSKTTPVNSNSPKGDVAVCPAGTVPIGGGGSINGGGAGITVVQDNPGATGWVFAAVEQHPGTAANWSVTIWAVCAPAPAGYVVATATGTLPTTSATASCPLGKKVIGSGGTLDTPAGDNVRFIESIQPGATLGSVRVRIALDPLAVTGYASPKFIAYAICITPQAGQQLVSATSASTSVDKSATAVCPFPTVAQGVGANVSGTSAMVNLTGLVPSGANAQVAAREHAGGYPNNWTVTAYAICLR